MRPLQQALAQAHGLIRARDQDAAAPILAACAAMAPEHALRLTLACMALGRSEPGLAMAHVEQLQAELLRRFGPELRLVQGGGAAASAPRGRLRLVSRPRRQRTASRG